MYIQWAIKGIYGISGDDADEMFKQGIICNWWRHAPHRTIGVADWPMKLTSMSLDSHVHR